MTHGNGVVSEIRLPRINDPWDGLTFVQGTNHILVIMARTRMGAAAEPAHRSGRRRPNPTPNLTLTANSLCQVRHSARCIGALPLGS